MALLLSEQKDVFLSVKLVNNVNEYNKTESVLSYNRAKMSYISSKNCPIILYFFCGNSVGTLIADNDIDTKLVM